VPYRDQPKRLTHNAPHRGREGKAYRDALEVVRERVRRGAPCWFWRRPGHEACPGRINLQVKPNTRWSFTAHHLQRLMDGGAAVDIARMVPAHRACNARDGLMAQNARRALQRARAGHPRTGARAGVRAQTTHGYNLRPISGSQGQRALPTVTSKGMGTDRQSRVW
jgi:hypothetical protein